MRADPVSYGPLPAPRRASLPITDRYSVFDAHLEVRSNAPEILEMFRAQIGCFGVAGFPAGAEPEVAEISYEPDGGAASRLRLDGGRWEVRDPSVFPGFVYNKVLHALWGRVQTRILVHAAAFSVRGEGLILAASAACGKTTLTLELSRRGYRILSDEVAALDPASGRLDPFPRSLGIREGTLRLFPELAGLPSRRIPLICGGYKRLVEVEAARPGSVGKACRPAVAVLLCGRGESVGQEQDRARETITVVLDRLDPPLEEELAGTAGLEVLSSDRAGRFPSLRIRWEGPEPAHEEVERICQRHGALVFDWRLGSEEVPDFDGPAELSRLPRSEMALALMRRLLGGGRSALLRERFGGRPGRLYQAVAEMLRGVDCYRLQVGPLGETADRIQEAIEERGRNVIVK